MEKLSILTHSIKELAQQNLECSFLYKKKYIKLHLPSSHSCEIQIMQNQVMW